MDETPEATAEFLQVLFPLSDPFYPLTSSSAKGAMLTNLAVKLQLLEYFPADLFGRSLVGQKHFKASVMGCLL